MRMLKLYWCYYLTDDNGMTDGEEIEAHSKKQAAALYSFEPVGKLYVQLIDEIEIYENRIREYRETAHEAARLQYAEPSDRLHWIDEKIRAQNKSSQLSDALQFFKKRNIKSVHN